MHRAIGLLILFAVAPGHAVWDEGSGTIITERWPGGLPLGGIGCNLVELLSDGALREFDALAEPAAPPRTAFFAVACGGVARLLRQPVPDDYPVAAIDESRASFQYPRGQIVFRDAALPVEVELLAASFIVPGQLADSTLPAALFRLTVRNPTARAAVVHLAFAPPLEAAVAPATATLGRSLSPGEEDAWWRRFAAGGAAFDQPGPAAWLARLEVPARGAAVAELCCAWDANQPGPPELAPAPAFERTDDVAALVDDNPTTIWTSARPIRALDAITVHLAAAQTVQEVVISPADERLVAGGFDVSASADGNAWELVGAFPLAAAQAALRGGVLSLPVEPRTAEQLRLTARTDGAAPWSIGEIQVTADTGIPMRPATADVRLRADQPPPATELGRYWRNRFATPRQVADYVLADADRLLAQTQAWQEPILAGGLPNWLKRKLLADLAGLVIDGALAEDGRYVSHTDGPVAARRYGSLPLRSATQPVLLAFLPELDARELRHFAAAIDGLGRLPEQLERFDGGPQSGSATGAAEFLLQVERRRRWTGDVDPRLAEAAVLAAAGLGDGDEPMVAAARNAMGEWRSVTPAPVQRSHAAALRGDWLERSLGLRPSLPDAAGRAGQLADRHLARWRPVPPLECDGDGMSLDRAAPVAEMQAWFGGALIRLGRADDGLAVFRAAYEAAWDLQRRPFAPPRLVTVPDGERGWGEPSSASLAGWEVLGALAGAGLDVAEQVLYLRPVLPTDQDRLTIPLFFPRFWAELRFAPGEGQFELRVIRQFGDPVRIARVSGAETIELPQPVALVEGATLDLSPWSNRLQPQPRSQPATSRLGQTNRTGRGYATGRWQVSAEGDGLYAVMASSPEAAIDGDRTTRWSTGRVMQAGDRFVVDFGEELTVGRVVLDSGTRYDYPRALRVDLSDDGRTWRQPADSRVEVDRDGVTTATFTPATCRWLRLTNGGTARGLYWSIHELYVFRE